jgi:hypothetical protein
MGALTRESGALRAAELFASHPDVDTVLCGNDLIALGVLDTCQELGRRIPGDVAVAGFDDLSFSSAAGPEKTGTLAVAQRQSTRADLSRKPAFAGFTNATNALQAQSLAGASTPLTGCLGNPAPVEISARTSTWMANTGASRWTLPTPSLCPLRPGSRGNRCA